LKNFPTRQQIQDALDVDVHGGAVFIKPRSGKGHARSRDGQRAGWIRNRRGGSQDRQIDFRIDGYNFRVSEHWLIWFWAKGRWPDYPREEIDHRDNDSLNNTISNLRLSTRKQNGHNSRLRKSSKTGYKWVQRHGDGYSFRMSGYKTAEAAHAAARKAARDLHGDFFNDGSDDPDALRTRDRER